MSTKNHMIESITKAHGVPFNYRYIKKLYDKDSLVNGDIEIVRPIRILAYNTDCYPASTHFKPISKIVDYINLV